MPDFFSLRPFVPDSNTVTGASPPALNSSGQVSQGSATVTSCPVSPIAVRLSQLHGLPGECGHRIRLAAGALSIGRPADAAAILIDLSGQCEDHPLLAGQIRMQAAPALIDAGQHARAWSCVQSAIRQLTSAAAVNPGRRSLQTAEWCVMSAVSACCGDAEMAETCSLRAIQSLSPCHEDAFIRSFGNRKLLLQYGDVRAVRASALMTGRRSFAAALSEWSDAYQMHYAAGDQEAALRDLLGMSCCEKSMGRAKDAAESKSMGNEILKELCTDELPGYAQLLLPHFAGTALDHEDDLLAEYWN